MRPAILSMLDRYKCISSKDYENALKEIIQEVALLGLWRSKFFEHAAFYGGTALRILYDLDRFSEDLDFSLLHPNSKFQLKPYLTAIEAELNGLGFSVNVTEKNKSQDTAIESGFIKAGTKEHLLRISVPKQIADRTHNNSTLNIKIDIDTDPSGGFETEVKLLLQPIPFSVNTYKMPDLFAGKIHAILNRNWKGRVKGRDYYDFVWYVAREVPVHLNYLDQRFRQSGHGKLEPLSHSTLTTLLQQQFEKLDVEAAKRDVAPFLRDPSAIELWSKDFFVTVLKRMKVFVSS